MILLLADLKEVVQIDPGIFQVLLRGTALYLLILFVVQFLRFHTNQKWISYKFSIVDLIICVWILLMVAENFSSNLQGYTTIPNLLVFTALLAFWNFLFNLSSSHYSFLNKVVLPPPLLLVKNGKALPIHMWWARITKHKLEERLQKDGINDILNVKRVFMEPDGTFVVLEN